MEIQSEFFTFHTRPKFVDETFAPPTRSREDEFLDAFFENERTEAKTVRSGEEKLTHVFQHCPHCGADEENFLKNDLLECMQCGEIIARPIDSNAEYRYFGSEDRSGGDPSRIGAPSDPRLPESSLGTMILPRGNAKSMNKVRRYHQWNLLPYKERTLLAAFDRLNLAATNHGFSHSVVEDAKELYVKLNGFCDRRGLSRDSLLASCVYTALKRSGSPRKPQDVGTMFSLSHATFTKAFKFFQEVLAQATQKGLLSENWTPSHLTSTKASDYIALPLSRLSISRADYQKIFTQAILLADRAEAENMSPENTPPSLAAGVIAYCCESWKKGEIPMESIASACDISVATLLKCLRRLQAVLPQSST